MGVLEGLCGAAVVVWAGALSTFDLRQRRLPNALTLGGVVAVLPAAMLCGRGLGALAGAAVLGAVYLAIHLSDPTGLGGGDVKLAVALGGLTGAFGIPVWLLAALGAPTLTAVAGTFVWARRRGRVIPHGPSMCMASLLAAGLAVL